MWEENNLTSCSRKSLFDSLSPPTPDTPYINLPKTVLFQPKGFNAKRIEAER